MDILVNFGSEMKVLDETPDAWRVGGYTVHFGTHDVTSLKDKFDAATDYDFENGESRTLYYHHGLDGTIKKEKLGRVKLEMKDAGVWYEGEIKKRHDYLKQHVEKIVDGIKHNAFGASSGAPAHLVERVAVNGGHYVKMWPIAEVSITPTPAEPLTTCQSLKSLFENSELETKAEGPFKFCSTQINLPADIGARLMEWAEKNIPDDALAADGRENQPHVTVLYGLEECDRAELQKLTAGFGPLRVIIGSTDIFEAEDYDVVYCRVDSPDLHRLRGRLETLPHTKMQAEYRPHATLAYVKKGMGKCWKDRYPFYEDESPLSTNFRSDFALDSFYLSDTQGELQPISTAENAAAKTADQALKTLETGQLTGSRFGEHTDRLLNALGEYATRFDGFSAVKAGRAISTANHERLSQLHSTLGEFLQMHAPDSNASDETEDGGGGEMPGGDKQDCKSLDVQLLDQQLRFEAGRALRLGIAVSSTH